MKTTIDLPDEVLHRAKVFAAERRTTLRELVLMGLQRVLLSEEVLPEREAALDRLRRGFRLGGRPLSRDKAHERT